MVIGLEWMVVEGLADFNSTTWVRPDRYDLVQSSAGPLMFMSCSLSIRMSWLMVSNALLRS